MPPRSHPRHPSEEESPEPYSLIVIVCSGKIQLQHKASCYRGHGYSNRLNSLQGCTPVQPARSDLQGGVHLVREQPTEAIRHAEAHPTAHQRGPRRSTVLSARGSWAIAPRTLGRCAPSGSSAAAQSDPTTMMNWTSFRAFERDDNAEGPHRNPTYR